MADDLWFAAHRLPTDDPLGFARTLASALDALIPAEACRAPAPRLYAVYGAILADLQTRHPAEEGFGRPLTELDEAAMSWASAAYAEGLAFGVAAESLRRAMGNG